MSEMVVLEGVKGERTLKKLIRDHITYVNSNNQAGKSFVLEDTKVIGIDLTEIVGEIYKETSPGMISRKLKGAALHNVQFKDCHISSLVFASSILDNVKFLGTGMSRTSFVSSKLTGCVFNSSSASAASFVETEIADTSFRSVKGFQTVFNRVKFSKVDIDFSEFPDSNIIECEFNETAIYSTTFNNATFSKNKFNRNCRLNKVSLLNVHTVKDQVLTISNFGTYEGPVYYFAHSGLVFAGCWVGTIDEFEVKYERKFENIILLGADRAKKNAEYQLQQFNLITAMLRNAETFYKAMPELEEGD